MTIAAVSTVRRRVLFLGVALAAFLLGSNALVARTISILQRKPMRDFPYRVGNWIGRDDLLENRVLEKLGVDDYLMREYAGDTGRFWLYIGYYERQGGTKTIHSPKHCYPGSGWEKISSSVVRITVQDRDGRSREIEVNRFLLHKAGEREIVYYWYYAGGELVATEIGTVIQRLWRAVLWNQTDGALVRLSARIRGGGEEEEKTIIRFIPAIYPLIPDYIPTKHDN